MEDLQEKKLIRDAATCGYCEMKTYGGVRYPTRDIFGNQYQVVQCDYCQAWSLHPRPDEALLRKAYDTSYYGETEKKFSFPLVEDILDWFRDGRARKLLKFVKENDNVLDIGCGNGHFLQSLLKYRKVNIFGVELPGKSAERAARVPGINLKTGSLEMDDFQPVSLHAITLFHVFEHLTAPSSTLDIIDRILMKGGVLIISFPNIGSWQSRIFKGDWLHLDPPRHLFFFTPKDFIALMQKRGYRLLSEKYGSPEQNPFGMVQSILNLFTRKREVLFEELKGNKSYTAEYQGFLMFLQKLFFFVSFPVFMVTNFISAIFKKGATVEFVFQKSN
ncbi:MAG: class I SAM-dependent methyltransferase [Bacteroidetes bacterium]|nr:class I SAM-dependent methyltransferase [Bacteroidota bacterium]